MNIAFLPQRRLAVLGACAFSALLTVSAAWAAGPLTIVDAPLFLNGTVAPLNMLVLGRDHKLYYEAYNDHSDLDGDGALDTSYKPDAHHVLRLLRFEEVLLVQLRPDAFRPRRGRRRTNKSCAGATVERRLAQLRDHEPHRRAAQGALRRPALHRHGHAHGAGARLHSRRTRIAGARNTRASP